MGVARQLPPGDFRDAEEAEVRVSAGRPFGFENSEDGTTSSSRHHHPAQHPIPGRTPHEVSSGSAHPLSAGGIAAGARTGAQAHKLTTLTAV